MAALELAKAEAEAASDALQVSLSYAQAELSEAHAAVQAATELRAQLAGANAAASKVSPVPTVCIVASCV